MVVDGAYLAGADGAVPGLANVDSHGYVPMYQAYRSGDWVAMRTEQDRLAALMEIVFVSRGVQGFGAGVGAFKTALQLLGIIASNQMPEPVQALQGHSVEAVRAVLECAGLHPC